VDAEADAELDGPVNGENDDGVGTMSNFSDMIDGRRLDSSSNRVLRRGGVYACS
jgi:hypothetical protein